MAKRARDWLLQVMRPLHGTAKSDKIYHDVIDLVELGSASAVIPQFC